MNIKNITIVVVAALVITLPVLYVTEQKKETKRLEQVEETKRQEILQEEKTKRSEKRWSALPWNN